MSNNGLGKRLSALEERTFGADPFEDFPDWDLTEQLEGVAEVLRWYRAFHADCLVLYPLTEREAHLLALLCAQWELGGPPLQSGEYRFPSGLTVAWRDNSDGTFAASASRWARLEDLPDDVRRHFKRMDPLEQPQRERFLYRNRHRAKKARERVRWHDENGWDEPTPRELRYWVTRGEGWR